MISAIGSSPAFGAASTAGVSTAGIEAQIARYKNELSGCVNCDSAKTPEGKAAIEALSNKITAAEARFEKIVISKQNVQQDASAAPVTNGKSSHAHAHPVASNAEGKNSNHAASASLSSDPAKGSLVNVFA